MPTPTLSPIIKSSDVNISGTFQLQLDGGACNSENAASPGSHSKPASARIVETSDTFATIELVCSCGTVSQIKCNYN